MLEPFYKNKFKQDVARMKKRGKQLRKLQEVISMLIDQHELPLKYRDHRLLGQYNNCRECHIEPDWLLIYLIEGKDLIFVRTGTHSDLFV